MEQEKHNLESLFRTQLDASPPAFDPSYWERAQKDIERMEKKRKRRRWGIALLFALGLLCLSAAGYWLLSYPKQTASSTHAGVSLSEEKSTERTQSREYEEVVKQTEAQSIAEASRDDKLDSKKESNPASQRLYETTKTSNKGRVLSAEIVTSFDNKKGEQPTATTLAQASITDDPTTFAKKTFDIQGLNPLNGAYFNVEDDVQTSALTIKPFFWASNHFYSEFGIGTNPSFASLGEQSWHYAPYVEFGIQRALSRRIGIETGLGYSTIAGINRSLERQDLSYSFVGSRRDQTLTHQQSQWLSLPLRLDYQLLPAMQLKLGVRLSYLVQTQGILETIEEDDLGTKIESDESVRQYMDGLRRLNYQLEAGISYRLGTRWELQTRAVQGLRSVTRSDILQGGGADRSLQLQLGIRWYLR